MKIILLDEDRNPVHEFDTTEDDRVVIENVIRWVPTGKYYVYDDEGPDGITFKEAVIYDLNPSMGG